MKKLLLFLMAAVFVLSAATINAQEVKKLTFDEVVKLAEEQSPNALIAKHRFRASYWQYRTFVAQYRPSLTLSGTTPDYSTAYERYGIRRPAVTTTGQQIPSVILVHCHWHRILALQVALFH
jgi:outer membrane protein TolC